MVERCEVVFYNLEIKSSFSASMSLVCDLHKLFSSGMALLGLLSLAVASISLKARLVLTFFSHLSGDKMDSGTMLGGMLLL